MTKGRWLLYALHVVLLAVTIKYAGLSPTGAADSKAETPAMRLVAFGDSLTAGYMLPPAAAFPVRLEAALKARGHRIEVINAGVSGDTTSGGLERLAWAVPDGTDAVILELGANDALRGVDPARTRDNLNRILADLRGRGIDVLVAGMRAPRNMGRDFVERFDAIFADLAKTHDALLYPFFLDGVALDPKLNLGDGMHPNAKGVDIIVERIIPSVEQLLVRARKSRQSKS